MSLFALHCKRFSLYSQLLCTPAISQVFNRYAAYKSQKFPDFKVIYTVDTIKKVSILNRIKYRMTILSAVVLPVSFGLQSLNMVSLEFTQSFGCLAFIVTLFLHTVGMFANNLVGYIYVNQATELVKISYVNYWGVRVDVGGKFDDISFSDTKNLITKPIFTTLNLKTCKTPLKFYANGNILDKDLFERLFGINKMFEMNK